MNVLLGVRRLTGWHAGQNLVLFALLLPVLIGLLGLALDWGYVLYRQVGAQGAADLAALAGVYELPASAATARTHARTIATAKGYTDGAEQATVTVNTPYGGHAGKIEVIIIRAEPTFFSRLFGYDTINIRGRAVAVREPGAYDVFASNSGCGANDRDRYTIEWSGSNVVVPAGRVHSNAAFYMGGSSNRINGEASFVCDKNVTNGTATTFFDSGNLVPNQVDLASSVLLPAPFDGYTETSFPCTWWQGRTTAYTGTPVYTNSATIPSGDFVLGSNSNVWVGNTKSSGQLKAGVYCVRNGKLELGDSVTTSSTATLVASNDSNSQILISSAGNKLTAHTNGIVAVSFLTRTDANWKSPVAIQISGDNHTFIGSVFAKGGHIELNGSGHVIQGSLVGDTIKINGSNLSIQAGGGGGRLRLIE